MTVTLSVLFPGLGSEVLEEAVALLVILVPPAVDERTFTVILNALLPPPAGSDGSAQTTVPVAPTLGVWQVQPVGLVIAEKMVPAGSVSENPGFVAEVGPLFWRLMLKVTVLPAWTVVAPALMVRERSATARAGAAGAASTRSATAARPVTFRPSIALPRGGEPNRIRGPCEKRHTRPSWIMSGRSGVPAPSSSGDVTGLLLAWGGGDQKALQELIPLVYDELRELAERYLRRERAAHTLQPTALVHEAYLKLVQQDRVTWKNRGHFFAVASELMRRLLVDHARKHQADKRGGGAAHVPLEEAASASASKEVDVVALDEALQRLAELDATQAKVVELRYFGGLTLEESAEVLGTSRATVIRAFRVARAWLERELSAA